MGNAIKYNGNNIGFVIHKKRLRLKKEASLFFFVLLIMLFSIFGIILISKSYKDSDNYDLVSYHETGNLHYKVYYGDGAGFETGYQPPNITYVTNLIEHINVNFDYSLNTDEILDTEYSYELVADLYIYNANGSKNIIRASSEVIKKSEVFSIKNKGFDIFEEIDIDYDKYNDEVNVLKNEYGLQITANVVISLNVVTNASVSDVENELSNVNTLSLTIPLSEQVLDIEMKSNSIDNSAYITDYDESRNNVSFYLGIAFIVIAVGWIILMIRFIFKLLYNKDIYQSTIKKYLREYDRLIVTSEQPDLDESSFVNKIRVMSIEELIDAHDSTGSPIIYYEVVPNEKSYFIIINGNTFYKLTISRTYLEENKKS